MRRCLSALLLLLPWLAAAGQTPAGDRFAVVTTAPVTTWIYVGTVTLTASPFIHHGAQFSANYSAKVFPYFFSSESGQMAVNVPPDALRRISAGQPINFSGTATRTDGTLRAIDGTATPSGRFGGTIKVRIHLSKKLVLVFDTTYRLPGAAAAVKASAVR